MSHELEQFHEIIEQLKPVVNEPDFGQILKESAKKLPKPHQHIIKLELQRQARTCDKIIDMRKITKSECQPFEHEGLIHYFTDAAQDVFERQIRAFGHYTQGVYEAVAEIVEKAKQ